MPITMDKQKNIFGRRVVFSVVIGLLFFVGVIWVGVDRSGTRVWERSDGQSFFGTDDIRTGTEEKFGVPEQEDSERSEALHPKREEMPVRKSETVVTPPTRQEAVTEIGPRSDTGPRPFRLQRNPVGFGFEEARRKARDIDTIVLHSSFNNQGGDRYSVDRVIDIWKSYGVAPHFLIDRKGSVYQLVDEENIAYHAGVSEMKDGRKNVNDFSFGVEILNAEDDEYTDAQYGAIRDLVAYLKGTHPIKYVVGHDDIAPGRKTDPWNFDWKRL